MPVRPLKKQPILLHWLSIQMEAKEYWTWQMFRPAFFERALENVVFLRAQTGGGLSRLNFALDYSMLLKKPTCEQRLVVLKMWILQQKQQTYRSTTILMQASAAMVAQANSHE